MNSNISLDKYIHFIGIGGSGMNGIAKVLQQSGYKVSGSDLSYNNSMQELTDLGCLVFTTQTPDNLVNLDVGTVVVSSAIKDTNAELMYAKQHGIPIYLRAQMLAQLTEQKATLAVCGTHGKSTSSAMLAHIYQYANLQPSFVIGAELLNYHTSAKYGTGEQFIIEADESDGSFLNYYPTKIHLTNIEPDHLENYAFNMQNMRDGYQKFLEQSTQPQKTVACIDTQEVRDLVSKLNYKPITYGFSKDADYVITNFSQNTHNCQALIVSKTGSFSINLQVSGQQNMLNALGSYLMACDEVNHAIILQGLQNFIGIGRRFEKLGLYEFNHKAIQVIDDYGHHPTEIDYTLKNLNTLYPTERKIVIFQPHRYSRLKYLFNEFVEVLTNVGNLFIMEVYSAGEENTFNITSKDLVNQLPNATYIDNTVMLEDIIVNSTKNHDVLLIQGAGNISTTIRNILSKFRLNNHE